MKKLLQLRELTPAQWADLSRALLLLPLTGIGLKVLGFRRTQKLLRIHPWPKKSQQTAQHDSLERARSAAQMVSLAARYGPYRATCLKKALVLHWMLEREHIVAELKIGVRRGAGCKGRKGAGHNVEAHAWVESSGVVLLDDSAVDERFATFDSLRETHES
ncbi:MAG: lasso peptide biosynthesis B2 protein [Deltaproteobacteria bacterium]|nr:lasso peptide biosynthesis B2 protein [Deltaproteobacteria bacterium]